MLVEIDHLNECDTFPLVSDNEGGDHLRQGHQKGLDIDLLELEREDLGFDPVRPIFKPSFAVRKAPKPFKKHEVPRPQTC